MASIDSEDYFNSESELIKYALLMMSKSADQKRITDGEDSNADSNSLMVLSRPQIGYLNMRMEGVPLRKICEVLNVPPITFKLWKEQAGENSLYHACLDAIDEINADMAEDITRDEAQTNRKAKEERMFYIKRWKQEYRENYQGSGANVVQVNITVDDKPYTVNVNTKEVNDAGQD
jgi:hypothetical protein